MMEHDERCGAYVEAAAALLGMPFASLDRAVVLGVTERLASFAVDVASVELAIDVEIAGRFEP